jgi:two-component system cell cycle sensor histidine kinase/response regulator CckA
VAAQPFVELKLSGHSAGEMDMGIGRVLLLSTKRSRTIALSCGYCFHSVVMFSGKVPSGSTSREESFWPRSGQVERRQWWLWASTIVVTLLLTAGMASFSYIFEQSDPHYSFYLRQSVRGLVALVFLFDLYTIYQQVLIQRIRRQLSEREELYRLISENAEDLIAVIGADGNSLYNSPGYTRLFGYTNEELQGVSIADQVHPEDRQRLLRARKEAFDSGARFRLEYRFRRKDGEWRILESTGGAVRNGQGSAGMLVAVSRDITERKHAEEILRQREEQLRQAQKMEAVGRLSGGIAHDFNNLLGVIIGYSEDIELRVAQADPLRKSAEEIRKAGQRAAALTQQLLAFSRQQVLQPNVLALNLLVSDMGKMLQRLIGAHIELSTNLDPELGSIKADQSQIEQVIVNLVVNARDAMPDGGKLVIETSSVFLDADKASSLPFLHPGPHALLTVTDTGVGMDPETQKHIFEPFFTTKECGKGTGLGLATVYGVVKQSGGVVGVHSEPGKGSTFKIYLPQVDGQSGTNNEDPSASAISAGTETVLVVENEDALLELTSDVLARSGYKVLSARDGNEAIEIARSFDGPIHLLMTDIVMSKLNGPALARHVTVLHPGIRVLFMTGHAEPDALLHENIPSNNECLQKPFHRDALIRKVRQTLDLAELQVRG